MQGALVRNNKNKLFNIIFGAVFRFGPGREHHTASHSSYLGKQFLLLSEEFLLRDAQVLEPGAGLPPLKGHSLALLQHILHLRYVRRETETLECCGARGQKSNVTSYSLNHSHRQTDRQTDRGHTVGRAGLTVDDVLGRDGLLVGLVAYFIGF